MCFKLCTDHMRCKDKSHSPETIYGASKLCTRHMRRKGAKMKEMNVRYEIL